MKISELNIENTGLSVDQYVDVVFKGANSDVHASDVVFLLGSTPERSIERARMAANFYHKGGAKYIVPSGGVKHEYNGETISECDIMTRCLIECGVPESAIIPENRARFTSENIIFSFAEATWVMGDKGIKSVTVITTPSHLRRGTLLARCMLRRDISVYGYTENVKENIADFRNGVEPDSTNVRNEVRWMRELIDRNWIDDIEI